WFERLEVCRERARLARQIGRIVELQRIDEDRHDHFVAHVARGAHQTQMPLVERSHGHDHAALSRRTPQLCGLLNYSHHSSPNVATRSAYCAGPMRPP